MLASQNSPLPTVAVGGIAEILELELGLVLVPTLWLCALRGSAHGPAKSNNWLDSAGLNNSLHPHFEQERVNLFLENPQ